MNNQKTNVLIGLFFLTICFARSPEQITQEITVANASLNLSIFNCLPGIIDETKSDSIIYYTCLTEDPPAKRPSKISSAIPTKSDSVS